MKAKILKQTNEIVDKINYIIKTQRELEQERITLQKRLSEHRNQLVLEYGLKTFMNIIDGFIVLEIYSK